MTSKAKIVFLSILLFIAAAIVAFYFSPYILAHLSFVYGFLSCLVLFSLLSVVFFFIKSSSYKQIGISNVSFLTIAVSSMAFGIFAMVIVAKQSQNSARADQIQLTKLELASERTYAIENANLMTQFLAVAKEANQELERNRQKNISDKYITRFAELSAAVKPLRNFEGDSLSVKRFSLERGQMLLTLIKMEMDSVTFAKVKSKVTFASAQLEGFELPNVDLSGADLSGANLKDANLENAELSKINLREACLWGAKLNGSHLREADLVRSNLDWAGLNRSNMSGAKLDGSTLRNAKIKDSNLVEVSLQWANLEAVVMTGTDFESALLIGSDFYKGNVSGANMMYTSLRSTKWEDADLSNVNLKNGVFGNALLKNTNLEGTQLDSVLVRGKDWFEKIETWHSGGADIIKRSYTLERDRNTDFYFLRKTKLKED